MNRDQALAVARSPHWSERAAAASVLAEAADRELGPILVKLLDDENLAVIEAAADALLKRADFVGAGCYASALRGLMAK
jgi:HEAT repeat protein